MGSVAALSDVNNVIVEQYSYDVFGEPNCTSDVNNPYYFTARRLDPETDNYYYRFRYYKPNIGRFLQTDPIGYYDSMNLYQYCFNNPINWIDPFGLTTKGADEEDKKSWWDKMWEETIWITPPWELMNWAWKLERERFPNRLDVGQGDYRHFVAAGMLNRQLGVFISAGAIVWRQRSEEDPLDSKADWRGWWHSMWHPFTPLQDLAEDYITRPDTK